MSRSLLLVLVFGLLAGCRNACQDICVDMRTVAEECGYVVSDDDFKLCLDEQKGKEARQNLPTCRQFGDEETIREEWTCDDLALYWEGDDSGS